MSKKELAYEKTHPWIKFKFDLRPIPWEMWLLAGEAVSKCEHLAGVALDPAAAAELMKIYLAKGALATTAIEGNTLTEDEVRQRIDGTLQLSPSKEYLGVEIDNVVRASRTMLDRCVKGDIPGLTPELISDLNREVLSGLKLEAHVVPGEFRTYSVGVADYRGAPQGELPELVKRLCKWLDEPWLGPMDAYRDVDRKRLEAILKSVVAHLYLAWIHPFGDGNGRTARLVESLILANGGVPAPAAHLLSNHYNETRGEYYRQLSYASKSKGDIVPFCAYALRGFVDQLRAQMLTIRDHQMELFWKNHVHGLLGDSETGRRRRYLIEDLSKSTEAISRKKLTDISVRVLRHYMGRNEKTLIRDLDELESLGLVTKVGEKYRANKEVILAYLPARRKEQEGK